MVVLSQVALAEPSDVLPYKTKVVAVVGSSSSAAVPDTVPIEFVAQEDCCPHMLEAPIPVTAAVEDSIAAILDHCSRIPAGTIRVIVYDYAKDFAVDFERVLSLAQDAARRRGVHGVTLESVRDYGVRSLWFDFMGVYHKGEVPAEFKGLK